MYCEIYVICKNKAFNDSTKTEEEAISTLLWNSYTLCEVLCHLKVDWGKLVMHGNQRVITDKATKEIKENH